ncbi:hypothetical protein AAIR98_001314 [Elusimicrobium simillimum]|uniref:hypothetical protein n=1 Tax=Elusimicrobium simillimum TaxID=3143438 RepID=UPI003C700BE5
MTEKEIVTINGVDISVEDYNKLAKLANAEGKIIINDRGSLVLAAPQAPTKEEQVLMLEEEYSLPRHLREFYLSNKDSVSDFIMTRVMEIEAICAEIRHEA